ncbi:unnamed protein product [Rhodiola kirilowii]
MKSAVIRGGGTLQAVSVDIPNEIIFCILMYLPVKSLLRFKTVSKSWNALITNPYFVREHHSKQPSSKLLFLKRQEKVETYGTSIIPMPLIFDTKLFAHSNVYQPVKPYLSGEYSIMGPCFGVYCFGVCSYKERSVKIEFCNIATGVTKVCHYLNFEKGGVVSCAFGFGCVYNDITSVPEFKVVALIYYARGAALNFSTHVYTSATDSWKSVESCQSLAYEIGIEVNGVIHWQAKKFILTFDLQKEVFGRIELPQVASMELLTKQDDRYLSLIGLTSDYFVDIWVMHVQGSWVRQAVVGKLTVSSTTSLLGYWHSVEGLLWKVDDEDDDVEVNGIIMAIGGDRYKFCVKYSNVALFDYVESLVSFNF